MAEYIERQKVFDSLPIVTEDKRISLYGAVADFMLLVSAIPAADAVEVKHGQWVQSGQCNHKPYRIRKADKWTTYKCSICGFSNGRRFNDNYCPNCGAKMDLGEET